MLSAVAIDTASGKEVTGIMAGTNFKFDLKPARHYDVLLKKPNNETVRLTDLSWYDDEPVTADAKPLVDDDRAQITQVLTGVARFTNNNRILAIAGDGERAVALLDLRRDSEFHGREGGEIIRRVEVWYLKNEAGGWAKVQQQDRVITRQRYTSADEFQKALGREAFVPVASGLAIGRGQLSKVAVDLVPATRPADEHR